VAMVLMKPLFDPHFGDGSALPQPPAAAVVAQVAPGALVDDGALTDAGVDQTGATAPSAQLGKPQLSPLKA
jgi:hypothetical protein